MFNFTQTNWGGLGRECVWFFTTQEDRMIRVIVDTFLSYLTSTVISLGQGHDVQSSSTVLFSRNALRQRTPMIIWMEDYRMWITMHSSFRGSLIRLTLLIESYVLGNALHCKK